MKPIKAILLAVALVGGGNAVAQDAQDDQEYKFPFTRHTVFVDYGYARLTNGVPEKVGDLSFEGLENGWDIRCGYIYNFNRKIGAGLLIDDSMNEKLVPLYDGSIKAQIAMTYVAPQFVFSVPLAPQSAWSLEARAGVGALFVHQSADAHADGVDKKETSNNKGWALNVEVGVEWRLSKLIGITAAVGDVYGQFHEKYEDWNYKYEKWSNTNRFVATAGLKFHF